MLPSAAAAQPAIRDTAWTIETGTYAGIRVPIDPELSRGERRGSARFLRAVSSATDERVVGWNPSRFPIAVAFRHGRGDAITAGDSAAFWEILSQVEADFGMRLFVPATVGPNDDPVDAIVVTLKARAGEDGVTLITWTSGGDVYDARVFLRDRSTLHDPRVVTHEMMHALGFGHTNRWVSIMNPSAGRIGRLTPHDVAYAQVGFTSRVSAQRSDMWQKLALALEREARTTSDPGEGCGYSLPSFPRMRESMFPSSASISAYAGAEAARYGDAAGVRSRAVCRFCLCSVP